MHAESIPTNTNRRDPIFVLLHGAGLGPWIWDSLRKRLPFRSVALEVPSRKRGTDPARCAREILGDPAFPASQRVVLVLHSLAGVLEAPLATALGARLAGVVHLASVVPDNGTSFAATIGWPNLLILRFLFWRHPDGLAPSPSMLRDQLCGDLDAEASLRVVESFQPEHPGLFLEPVPDRTTEPRRVYLVCAKDRSVPPGLQRRMARRMGAGSAELDCGHLPMLSHAELLASLVVATARDLLKETAVAPDHREATTTDRAAEALAPAT